MSPVSTAFAYAAAAGFVLLVVAWLHDEWTRRRANERPDSGVDDGS